MSAPRRALLLSDPWPQAVPPAIPRWVPLSPDQRVSGQARSLLGVSPPRVETAIEAAQLGSSAVVVTPEWEPADPEIVGELRVVSAPPGGPAWERVLTVPGWGIVVPTPGGIVQVEALIDVAGRRWWVGVAPAYARTTYTAHETATTVALGVTIDFDPPRYATRARIFVSTGSVSFPDPTTPAVGAPAELVVPASRVSVTGVAAASGFLLQWETFA